MSDNDDRPVLRFTLRPSWDARPHHGFFYAPDNWDSMTEAEREKFMTEEVDLWRCELVGRTFTAYANAAEAQADDHGWGDFYDDPEERW